MKTAVFLTVLCISIELGAYQVSPIWGPPVEVVSAESAISRNQVYRVSASPDKGFYWPYFFTIPDSLKPNLPILFIPNNDGQIDIEPIQREYFSAIINEEGFSHLGKKLGVVTFTPSFPRPRIEPGERNLYLHALTRESLLTTNPTWTRLDRQVLAMKSDLHRRLSAAGIETDSKLINYGFSAAADFVTRFTAIQPQHVKAMVAGGLGGLPILPVTSFKDKILTYPVGIGDLEEITQTPFNQDSFSHIPMLFVQGTEDVNDSVIEGDELLSREGFFSDSYSYEQTKWINSKLGLLPIERLNFVRQAYKSIVMQDFAYAEMEGEKHRDKKIKPNAVEFFQCVLEERANCALSAKQRIENFEFKSSGK